MSAYESFRIHCRRGLILMATLACFVISSKLYAQTPQRIMFWNIQGGGYPQQARTDFNDLDRAVLKELQQNPQTIFVFAEFHSLAFHPEVLRQLRARYHSTFAAYDEIQVPDLGVQVFSPISPEKVIRENLSWTPSESQSSERMKHQWSNSHHSQVYNRPYLELTFRDVDQIPWRLVPFHLLESIKGFVASPGWRNPLRPYLIQLKNFRNRAARALNDLTPVIFVGDANAPASFPIFPQNGPVQAVRARHSSWFRRGTFPRNFCANLFSQIQFDQVFRSGNISVSARVLNHNGSDHAAIEILPH